MAIRPLLLASDSLRPTGNRAHATRALTTKNGKRNEHPCCRPTLTNAFLNAASPGLIAPKYLQGNEPVIVENASANGILDFQLPGTRVRLRTGKDVLVGTHLDTVIFNTDDMLLLLLWRNYLVLRNGPHDVAEIICGAAKTSKK